MQIDRMAQQRNDHPDILLDNLPGEAGAARAEAATEAVRAEAAGLRGPTLARIS